MLPKFAFTLTLLLLATALSVSAATLKNAKVSNVQEIITTENNDRAVPKRSLSGYVGDASFGGSFGTASTPWAVTGAHFANSLGNSAVGSGWNPWQSYSTRLAAAAPSPTEVANSIAAAKQASANVLIAQQQMQAAKENVLNQQRMAMEKEAAATILTQKSEAAAAIQRSEAAAAAQAVVLAQQRLAASKAAVAHQQRIAAAREAEAAAALQRSAHAAAAEIQKTEYEAAKFGQYTRNGNAGAAHHLTLTKDNAFNPINAGNNHAPMLEGFGPWASASAGAKPTPATQWL